MTQTTPFAFSPTNWRLSTFIDCKFVLKNFSEYRVLHWKTLGTVVMSNRSSLISCPFSFYFFSNILESKNCQIELLGWYHNRWRSIATSAGICNLLRSLHLGHKQTPLKIEAVERKKCNSYWSDDNNELNFQVFFAKQSNKLTSWSDVRYFFHHKYFLNRGPNADNR